MSIILSNKTQSINIPGNSSTSQITPTAFTTFIQNRYFNNDVAYMGQAKIAAIVADYLGQLENFLAQKKDYIDGLFTCVDENTRCLKRPSDVFWALGADFWRQIIDGKWHYLNSPLVFDLGLHRSTQRDNDFSSVIYKEPGFYLSMYNGCRFAANHINDFLSVSLYQKLHRILCAHFPTDQNLQKNYGTLMPGNAAGIFRLEEGISCQEPIYNLFPLTEDQVFKNYSPDELIRLFSDIADISSRRPAFNNLNALYKNHCIKKDVLAEFKWGKSLIRQIQEKIEKINAYIKQKSQELNASKVIAIVSPFKNDIWLRISYNSKPSEIPYIVEKVFREFEVNIAKASTRDKKIRCIAHLYQMLEWIHPFPDGQGRTDLVLLAYLLSRHGINPSILIEPYVSTFCTSEEWSEYLEKGITMWQEKYLSLSQAKINQISYMGQAKIAEIVAGYLNPDEENFLAQKKDYVDSLFTCVDENTCRLNRPFSIFWALGSDYWRQIIDGKWHYLNSRLVFDCGLHGYQKEPGFFESLRNGCRYATMNFNNLSSVSFYQNLNKTLCEHFPSDQTLQEDYGTLMSSTDAGSFRLQNNIECEGSIYCLYPMSKDLVFKNFSTDELSSLFKDGFFIPFVKNSNEWDKENDNKWDQIIWAKSLSTQLDKKIEEINEYIAKRSFEVGASNTIAVISKNDSETNLKISYYCDTSEMPAVVENVFNEFEANIAKAQTRDDKIRCIADLYQMLEWIHPFPDGQGRTDLVLLAALLSKHGINPSILMEPYVSTFCSIEDWTEYLKKGIIMWQDKYLSLSKDTPVLAASIMSEKITEIVEGFAR